jgi:DNA-binding NtrC family response regulator
MFREPKAGPAKIMAPQSLAEQEMDLIWASLERNRYNKVSTATELGLSRTTLWRKMKQYNIPMKSTNSNYSTSTQRNSL